jgi:hypothetical protein
MKSAPNGAVKKIESTATLNMIFPFETPRDNGMDAMDACTVVFSW